MQAGGRGRATVGSGRWGRARPKSRGGRRGKEFADGAEMNPRLIIIAGPSRGTVFALADDETSVGREPSNTVHLADPSVSRKHCLVTREGDSFSVVDLGSFNGTFVNGAPVKEAALQDGDEITVGDILLLFLRSEGEGDEAAGPVQVDERHLITRSTIRLRREDSLYLRPDKLRASLPPASRVARDLNALLSISAAINSVRGVEPLQRRLLDLILEVIPAERACSLLVGETSGKFISTCAVGAGAGEPVSVSRTIVDQVLQDNVAVLCNDVSADNAPGGAESLLASLVQSLLCVPLVLFGKALGVIYADTRAAGVRFDEGHLHLLTAAASSAAVALENAQRIERLEVENERLSKEVKIEHRMVGESPPMREMYRLISKVAPSDSTVLIRGESGTGKELAAHAIHHNSPRAGRAFVAINCATLSEALLESELFGHEKGAFTGAVAQKRGKLEVAAEGTLFLDEVGELTPAIQAKLLRVLQEREFERVGGRGPIKVDVRVLAATNKDLEGAVRAGEFRQDLYYRLNVISLNMPPLRERREDIPLLANYFAVKCAQKAKRRVLGVSAEARACLIDYDWPGNVREMENAIERAVVLGAADYILPEDLPESVLETAASSSAPPQMKYYDAVKEAKKSLILDALEQAGGSYTAAAKLLGIHPNNLHRLMRNMNLKPS